VDGSSNGGPIHPSSFTGWPRVAGLLLGHHRQTIIPLALKLEGGDQQQVAFAGGEGDIDAGVGVGGADVVAGGDGFALSINQNQNRVEVAAF